jgi:histidyl-tRNA synthetase
MAQKPSIPKGTRDFSPETVAKRAYIFDTIKSVFIKYGFMPIETPSMENLSTLTGKYGDEGDKLLFRILNSGDFLSKTNRNELNSISPAELSTQICEKGLRYDLTVPFARYVVQHRNDITFPFRRYQIQPVWRADRPQKGRYREFYQCDADIIGSDSLINELDLLQMTVEVFKKLNISIIIRVNNRKILSGLAEAFGLKDKTTAIATAIDKLDKAGLDAVIESLSQLGLSQVALDFFKRMLDKDAGFTINNFQDLFSDEKTRSETGLKGVEELAYLMDLVKELSIPGVAFDFSLARGLDYYTGTIFEIATKDFPVSIGGGGRYDNLTGIFGLNDVSGVGISYGAERLFDIMEQQNLFPESAISKTQIMFAHFGEKEANYCLGLLNQMREKGISAEIYPDNTKLKKQMAYANSKGIHYVALIGEQEIKDEKITLKNMKTGEQNTKSFEEVAKELGT